MEYLVFSTMLFLLIKNYGNDLLEKLNGKYLFKVNSGGIWISKFSCLEIQVRASWVFLCGKQELELEFF